MGYLGRRIGLSQDTADRGGGGGSEGGGILDLFSNGYFQREGNITNAPALAEGMEASGGVISDYTDGGSVYRAHVFTASGTFTVVQAVLPEMIQPFHQHIERDHFHSLQDQLRIPSL